MTTTTPIHGIQSTNTWIQTRSDTMERQKPVRCALPFNRVLERPGSSVVAGATSGAAGGGRVDARPLGCWSYPAGSGEARPSELEQLREVQAEGRLENLELIELQQAVQRENCRFTTLSNLLAARHETAKAAINNIRV